VVIATIPAGLCGLLLDGWIETNLRSLAVIGCASIGFGLLLAWSDRAPQSRSELGALRWRDAIWVGCAQALALIPGTSRSGITMTAGRALGFDRATAARFSFLLSIPLILAAGMLKGLDLWQSPQPGVWGQAVVGALVAGVSAYLCIHWFLRLVDRIGFMPFVLYRVVLGALLLGLAFGQ
jgi:undecaprenyl-diphosphatase